MPPSLVVAMAAAVVVDSSIDAGVDVDEFEFDEFDSAPLTVAFVASNVVVVTVSVAAVVVVIVAPLSGQFPSA